MKNVSSVKVIVTMMMTVFLVFAASNVMAAIQCLLVALEQTRLVMTIAMIQLHTVIVYHPQCSATRAMTTTLMQLSLLPNVVETVTAIRIVNLAWNATMSRV